MHPLPHFAGGLVGEGDGQDRRCRHFVGGDQVRDAVRDDAGLAAAGAGQDQQRPVDMGYGFALLGIQPLEEIHENKRGNSFSLTCGPHLLPRARDRVETRIGLSKRE